MAIMLSWLSTLLKHWVAALEVTLYNDLCDLDQFRHYPHKSIAASCISLRKVAMVAVSAYLRDEYAFIRTASESNM